MKCPSGCRLQGDIDATEQSILKRFGQICDRAKDAEHQAKNTMLMTKLLYFGNRKIIVKNYVAEGKHLVLMDELQKNLTSVRKRAIELSTKLKAQYNRLQQQIATMYQIEVDIDIKIRACQGSCKIAEVYSIDKESYRSLEKAMHRFQEIFEKKARAVNDVGALKMKPELYGPLVSLRAYVM
ncbi:hypothetical protein AGOR_G00234080 [Albula goreensis]|uniref:Fibrinogen alpha/beta/gamma chain coiled coil domain-containing protein n=1 Tax=Albula goreensis TaxID=1534307 RepID=A0A8T3CF66_9TELE|nr:hypothetical protein AGOR_G00234080 [Albula goreensis]